MTDSTIVSDSAYGDPPMGEWRGQEICSTSPDVVIVTSRIL